MTMDTKPGFQHQPIGLAIASEGTPTPSPNKMIPSSGARASGNGQHPSASSFLAGKPGVKSMMVSSAIPDDRCKECGGALLVDRGESVCKTCGLVVDREVVPRPNFREQTDYHAADSGYWAENVPFFYRPNKITGIFRGKPFGDARERATWPGEGDNRSFINHYKYIIRQLYSLSAGVLANRVFYLFFKAKQYRRWPDHHLLAASCIFIALREARRVIRFDELVERFVEGRHMINASSIMKTVREIVDHLAIKLPPRPAGIEVQQITNKLVAIIGDDQDAMALQRQATSIMRAVLPRLAGKSPFGIAAGSIYLVSKKMGLMLTQETIARAADITEVTLRHQCHRIIKMENVLIPGAVPEKSTVPAEPMARLDKAVANFKQKQSIPVATGDTNRFTCEKCQKAFSYKRDLNNHQRLSKSCNPDLANGGYQRGYHCTEPGCTRVVPTRRGLTLHKAREHDIHTYRCPACNTSCDTKGALAQHAKDVHTKNAKKLIALTKDAASNNPAPAGATTSLAGCSGSAGDGKAAEPTPQIIAPKVSVCQAPTADANEPRRFTGDGKVVTEPAPWVCGKCGSDWVYKATRTNNKPSAWICFKCNHATMEEPARQCIAPILPGHKVTGVPDGSGEPLASPTVVARELGAGKASASERFKAATGENLDPYEARAAPAVQGVPLPPKECKGVPLPIAVKQALGALTVDNGVVSMFKKPLALGGGLDHAIMIPRVYIKEGLVDPTAEYKVFLIKKDNLEA